MREERGSFVTEHIRCPWCFEAAKNVLSVVLDKRWKLSYVAQSHIIAGRIYGLPTGDEIKTFQNELILKLQKLLCHPMRIAVLAEKGERIFHVEPYNLITMTDREVFEVAANVLDTFDDFSDSDKARYCKICADRIRKFVLKHYPESNLKFELIEDDYTEGHRLK